jgi:hypothetical protein
MRLVSLSEIPGLDDGEPIPSLAGRVEKVYQRHTGTSSYGDWSFQDFILSDGENTVTCKAKNMDPFDDMQGRDVVIECSKSDKHGLTGVTKLIDNYEGKIQHKIKLTGSCKIRNANGTLSGGVTRVDTGLSESPAQPTDKTGASGSNAPDARTLSAVSAPTEPDAPQPTHSIAGKTEGEAREGAQSREGTTTQSMRDSRGGTQNGVTEARQHLMRASNLYCLCVKAVDTVIAPKLPLVAQTSDMFQAAVGTLFIEASRAGLVQKMPGKTIE